MNTLDQLTAPIAILNGGFFLDGSEEVLFNHLLPSAGFEPILIDGLFTNPEKLTELVKLGVKTIVVQTTGQNRKGIEKCLLVFEKIGFIPENIVLIFPDNIWSAAHDFKTAHPQTKIFECFAHEARNTLNLFEEIEF